MGFLSQMQEEARLTLVRTRCAEPHHLSWKRLLLPIVRYRSLCA